MSTNWRNWGRPIRRTEKGNALVLVTVFMVALFGFAALSMGVALVFRAIRYMHTGTDMAALAGVQKLGDPAAAIAEAALVAASNGVTAAEIAAGARNGYPGLIQVGNWNQSRPLATRFQPDGTPLNAVRVPARRVVDLIFGKVVGFGAMNPSVDSVAIIEICGVPVAADSATVDPLTVGSVFPLSVASPGNWRPIEICDTEMKGAKDVTEAIIAGCCTGSGATGVPVNTGFEGVKDGYNARLTLGGGALIFIMPVVDQFPKGGQSETVTVVDFILVKLVDATGSGFNFTITLEVLGKGLGAVIPFSVPKLVE